MVVVKTQELVKHYGAMAALDRVSLELAEGSVTGLLGPNGAGKTTLMKTLLGFLPYSAGSCFVLGHDVLKSPLEVRRKVGFMPENEAWFPHLTGLEAVVYAGRLSGMAREDAFSRSYEVLDYLGMDEVRHRPVDGYSVGLKQKIKLAQAVVHGPRLCFLDEPLSGLDPNSRTDMMALLTGIAEAGVSMVISSHVLTDIETLCSSVVVLNQGRLLHSGPVEQLRHESSGHYRVTLRGNRDDFIAQLPEACSIGEALGPVVDVRLPSDTTTTALWTAAQTSGVQIRKLAPASDSLEQAFLRLLGKED